MDGLKISKTPPFVLLATNFPRDLDHAVLRRVPSRIYIGLRLPPKGDRVQIFKICLKDEVLGADVDFEYLGQKSWRYSGSDIKSVYVQAALICDTFVSGDDQRRLLKQMHFEKAFQRSPATVSKSFLAGIKAFAKEFDPTALEKMVQAEELRTKGHSRVLGSTRPL
jgi:SpoVK/Ycf46/Vps4 family AAA+-type ATPase